MLTFDCALWRGSSFDVIEELSVALSGPGRMSGGHRIVYGEDPLITITLVPGDDAVVDIAIGPDPRLQVSKEGAAQIITHILRTSLYPEYYAAWIVLEAPHYPYIKERF